MSDPEQEKQAFLSALAQRPPSKEALTLLAEQDLASNTNDNDDDSVVSFLYLIAAARHLPVEQQQQTVAQQLAPAANIVAAVVELSQQTDGQVMQTVLNAIGRACRSCSPERITQSGIVHVLSQFLLVDDDGSLTPARCEWIQAAVAARHYSYVVQHIRSSWPRPAATGTTVQHVLRYYYLAGTAYRHVQNYDMAIRCYWTCCSIPATDRPSEWHVAAWKELVLVQCLRHTASPKSATLWRLPAAAPVCLSRLVEEASESPKTRPTSGSRSNSSSSSAPENVVVMDVAESSRPQQQQQQLIHSMHVFIRLARAFCDINHTEFARVLEQESEVLRHEELWDLIDECRRALVERQLYALARVYTVVPARKLQQLLQLESSTQLHNLLLHVSLQRGWKIDVVTNDNNDDMIMFGILPATAVPSKQDLVKLTKTIRELDAHIACSNKYVFMIRKENKSEIRGVADLM